MPRVTVVVPIRNEAKSIEGTLRSLMAQDFPPDDFEVIVADGLSTDETVPIVRRLQREYPNIRLFFNPLRYSSAARNLAIQNMTGDYAVIVDGHCQIPDRHYLRNLVDAFESTGADSLGRPQPLDAPNPTAFQRAVSAARASKLGHNPDSDIFSDEAKFVEPQNTAIAYRRKVFETIGLFDPKFDACEDVEFNHRVHHAGMTCYFTPKLKVLYHPRGTWPALFRQLGRYGAGRARLAVKDPRSITLPALVPPLWMLWLVFTLPLAVLLPDFRILYFGLLGLYAAAILGQTGLLGLRQRLTVTARIPLVFLAIHAGFAWGFWRELARNLHQWRQRHGRKALARI